MISIINLHDRDNICGILKIFFNFTAILHDHHIVSAILAVVAPLVVKMEFMLMDSMSGF